MTFQRFGRSVHVRIETAADLAGACELDEAHWVATGAPVSTINCDPVFLALVDSDHNGRILPFEIRQAVGWLLETLTDHSAVASGSTTLRLEHVRAEAPDGPAIGAAAAGALHRLGCPDAGEVTLEQVRRVRADIEAAAVSEAGVVLPTAAEEPRLRAFLADVVVVTGGAPHPGGERGVGVEQLEAFLAAAAAAVEWHARGELPAGAERTDILPLGADTAEAFAALEAVRAKLDQYFAQCEAVVLDERLAGRMGVTDEELAALDFDDPATIERVLREAPLAPARPDRVLDLAAPVNPHYAGALERFRRRVVEPLLGADCASLAAGQWASIKATFAAHKAWLADAPHESLRSLGAEKLREYLDGQYAAAVRELIAAADRIAADLEGIRRLEKLILYQAHLLNLANNFISFPHLYDPRRRAMFEMGTLVMDGRRFQFAVRVEDRARHAEMARTSNMCLLYVAVRPPGGEPYEVAVPVTAGGRGNLCAGKRGVFHDLAGAECDATVVGFVENPISLAEAFVSPFRRLGRLVTGKIESLTAQAEKKLDTTAAAALDRATTAPPPAPTGKAPAIGAGGMLMGFGVAGAAVGSALAYIAKTVSENPLAILIGLGTAVGLVIVPTSIVAWLKLRRRDLGAVLEASGWAINARMRLTWRLGRFFTRRPPYPPAARGAVRFSWRGLVVAVVFLAAVIAAAVLLRRHLVARPAATQPAASARPPSG